MAYSVESKSNNPANALRDALERAERLSVQLSPGNVEDFLLLLDQIDQYFETIDNGDIDLRPEEVRWQSLLNRLNSKPQPLTTAAARAGGGLGRRRLGRLRCGGRRRGLVCVPLSRL